MKKGLVAGVLLLVFVSTSSAFSIIKPDSFGWVDKRLMSIMAIKNEAERNQAAIDAFRSGQLLVFKQPTRVIIIESSFWDSTTKVRLINPPIEFWVESKDLRPSGD